MWLEHTEVSRFDGVCDLAQDPSYFWIFVRVYRVTVDCDFKHFGSSIIGRGALPREPLPQWAALPIASGIMTARWIWWVGITAVHWHWAIWAQAPAWVMTTT
jgi:hypothetical protein